MSFMKWQIGAVFLIWCDFNNCRHILDEGFRADNILKDISYQLEHLKHHPCILLWCGGNESYLWANRRTLGAGPYIGRKTIKRIRELAARRDPEPIAYTHLTLPPSALV